MGKVTIAIIADIHIGSTVGLCPPEVKLDDGGVYHHSPAQAWLWQSWLTFWDQVRSRADGGEVWAIWCGDVLENQHHRTTQLWSFNQADWYKAASLIFQSVRPVARQFFLRGTEAHDGVAGQLVEVCTPENVVPDGENRTWWHLAIEVEGHVIEFWHHGRLGNLPWTRANVLIRLSSEVVVDYHRRGRRIPDIIFTAHTHIYDETPPTVNPMVVSLPAWQLATAWSWRQAHKIASIGGVILVCQEGEVSKKVVLFAPSESKVWRPPRTI